MTDPVSSVGDREAPKHTQLRALAKGLGLTVEELAARYGKSRRTLYKWADAGCPFDSEPSLRAWAYHHKHHLPPTPPPGDFSDLRTPIAAAEAGGPKNALESPAGQEGVSVPAAPADGGTQAPIARLQERTADVRELQARKLQNELDEQDRVLIHRDVMITGFGALSLTLVSELTSLDSLVLARLPPDYPAELRADVRRAAKATSEYLRTILPDAVRTALETALLGRPR